MIELYPAEMPAISPMRAVRLLRENIAGLLRDRGYKQKDLAQWCGHSEAWISAFLREERDIPMKDFDRIADFFGLATYQLFQPGVTSSSERRAGSDRRSGKERRISHATRELQALTTAIDSAHPRRHARGDAVEAADGRALSLNEIRQYILDLEGLARRMETADRSDADADAPKTQRRSRRAPRAG